MTAIEIATIGKEFHDNYYSKYHHYVEHTYKYRGEYKVRKVLELTAEGNELLMGETLNTPAFICPCCRERVSFNDLEYWGEPVEDVVANMVTCSTCYEDEMGEDL